MQAAMVCNGKGLTARRPTLVFGAKAKQASSGKRRCASLRASAMPRCECDEHNVRTWSR